jgi:glutathione S-transferase
LGGACERPSQLRIASRKAAAEVGRLKESPYLAGAEFTVADISCGYAIGFARSASAKLDPVLTDYLARLTARPEYKRAAETGATRVSG